MAYARTASKSAFALVFLLLAGIVLGGFLGTLADGVKYLEWLNFGYSFGMESPLALDLHILFIQIQISLDINIASLLGIVIAIFIYRKI